MMFFQCIFINKAISIVLNNVSAKVCFTPEDKCTQYIVDAINSAKNNINIQAYSFTNKNIIQAIIHAKQKGINVHILLDKINVTNKYNITYLLNRYHIDFLIDDKPTIAHNKIIIIDSNIVITGSFNFTKSAQDKNAENVLIIHSEKLANIYYKNFLHRQNKSISINQYYINHLSKLKL